MADGHLFTANGANTCWSTNSIGFAINSNVGIQKIQVKRQEPAAPETKAPTP